MKSVGPWNDIFTLDMGFRGLHKKRKRLKFGNDRASRHNARAPWSHRLHGRFFRVQWNRQGGRCFYCREAFPMKRKYAQREPSSKTTLWHLEHKIPVCRGGTNTEMNLVLACRRCNLAKGRKTADEFMQRPFIPKVILRKRNSRSKSEGEQSPASASS